MFECTERTLEEHFGLGIAIDGDAKSAQKSHPESSPEPPSTPLPQRRKKLVYLTSDSPNTLDYLEDDTVYVIGGIVDRNRLKRATIDRAEHELNIETAKLPLREFLLAIQISMTTTKVLTVNHIFDILLKYREHGNDWNEAFRAVLPRRKV